MKNTDPQKSLSFTIGALRLVCTNGMTTMERDVDMTSKHNSIEFLEHDHHREMTKVVYENGHTYDLENSEDYRVELAKQHAEIMRLRKALADALESMEDADMQLSERVIRLGLYDKVY